MNNRPTIDADRLSWLIRFKKQMELIGAEIGLSIADLAAVQEMCQERINHIQALLITTTH